MKCLTDTAKYRKYYTDNIEGKNDRSKLLNTKTIEIRNVCALHVSTA